MNGCGWPPPPVVWSGVGWVFSLVALLSPLRLWDNCSLEYAVPDFCMRFLRKHFLLSGHVAPGMIPCESFYIPCPLWGGWVRETPHQMRPNLPNYPFLMGTYIILHMISYRVEHMCHIELHATEIIDWER